MFTPKEKRGSIRGRFFSDKKTFVNINQPWATNAEQRHKPYLQPLGRSETATKSACPLNSGHRAQEGFQAARADCTTEWP